MQNRDSIDENRVLSETRLEKTSLEAPEALDTIPLYLTHEEREILILFLNEVSNLSALYVERVIQTAYLFYIADLPLDLNGSPYLMDFLRAAEQYMLPESDKELIEAIKKLEKYLLPEGKINAEIKRQKLITEVNKLVPKVYAVPSHRFFGITLEFLKERGYLITTKNKSRTLWSINPDFYRMWSVRRNQLFKEREQKIKELLEAGIKPLSQVETKANDYMLDKYGVIILDFYNVKYEPHQINNIEPDIKGSVYLRYREPVIAFLPK